MKEQKLMELWVKIKRAIWQKLVLVGRRNVIYRAGILFMVAVGLFLHHLMRYVRSTPVRRFVCVTCVGILVLNSMLLPGLVWAEGRSPQWEEEFLEGDDTQGLQFRVMSPEKVIEGYQQELCYQVKVTNPGNGEDLSGIRVAATMGDVYLLIHNEETGFNEEVCIFRLAEAGQEDDPEEEEDSELDDTEEASTEAGTEADEAENTEETEGTESDVPETEAPDDSESDGGDGTSDPNASQSAAGSEDDGTEQEAGETSGDGETEGAEGAESGEASGSEPAGVEGAESGEASGSEPAGVEGAESGEASGSEPAGVEGAESGEASGSEPAGVEGAASGEASGSEPAGVEGAASGSEPAENNGAGGTGSGGASGTGLPDNWLMSAPRYPVSLAAGETKCFYVYIPLGLNAGEYIETLTFRANELKRPIVKKLSVVITEAPEEEETETNSSEGEEDSTETETSSTEVTPNETETPSDVVGTEGGDETGTGTETETGGGAGTETGAGAEGAGTETGGGSGTGGGAEGAGTETGAGGGSGAEGAATETGTGDGTETETGDGTSTGNASGETETGQPEGETGSSSEEDQGGSAAGEEGEPSNPEGGTGGGDSQSGGNQTENSTEEPDATDLEGENTDPEYGEDENPGEGDPTESGDGQEEPDEQDGEETDPQPRLKMISCEGGYFMGKTFFVLMDATFELEVDEASVKAVFCEMEGGTTELEVIEGVARFVVPETYSGALRFYAVDAEDQLVDELVEYVIAEKTAPTLWYENEILSTNGMEIVYVVIEDGGDAISGLNEISCMVDGEEYAYEPEVFRRLALCSGEEVVSGISFDIPLADKEIHTIVVTASDNVGNILEKEFRVCSTQMDVVSVLLPTSFDMPIFPYASNDNIWGEDIVIVNQSDFPVRVTLKSAQIGIDHTVSAESEEVSSLKDAKLNFNIYLSEDRNTSLELSEGRSAPGNYFVLAAQNPDTDFAKLQEDKSDRRITSGDYAIANVRGTIEKGSEKLWKDGDITVALTFTFMRAEEAAEDEEEQAGTEVPEEDDGLVEIAKEQAGTEVPEEDDGLVEIAKGIVEEKKLKEEEEELFE